MKYTVENTVKVGRPVRAYVDGVEAKAAVEVDDEKGYIIFNKMTPDGDFIFDEYGNLATSCFSGRVVVEECVSEDSKYAASCGDQTIIDDIDNGGPISLALQQVYGLRRRGA